MSRLKELQKQYPELNLTIFDLLCRLDPSKTYKYLPLLCKLFGGRFNLKTQTPPSELYSRAIEIKNRLETIGINCEGLTHNQIYFLYNITDHFSHNTFLTFNEFSEFIEKGLIPNKDITSYSSVDEMRSAISIASIKEFAHEMENQVIKEYEDETWVIVRPLTFLASIKYGAGTRWCTTSKNDKQYFEKYWRTGVLVYFLNKKTGYKFAGFKDLENKELSFWNAEDSRVDYLDVNVDDYLFPIVRKIFKSTETNKNLCSADIQEQVHQECLDYNTEQPHPVEANLAPIRNLWVEETTSTAPPVYEQPDIA